MTVITNPPPPARRSGSKIVKAFFAILLIGSVTIAASIMMADDPPVVEPREVGNGPIVTPTTAPSDDKESADWAAALEKAIHDGDDISANQILDGLLKGDKRLEAVDRFHLLTAVRLNRVNVVERMLRLGLGLNAVDNTAGAGDKATHVAATLDDPTMIALLVGKGQMKVDELNAMGKSPLHVAATMDKVRVVQKLIELKADPKLQDPGGNTPLHLAAREGHGPVVEALMKGGADPAIQNGKGKTAADLAPNDEVKLLAQ